jgi:hypothetical protein
MPEITTIVLGTPGPSGAGITTAEKVASDARLTVLEGRVMSGAGSPENVTTAGASGVLYENTSGVVGQVLWTKAGGAGNDTWVAVDGVVRYGREAHAYATPNAATITADSMSAWTLGGTASNADHSSGPAVNFATSGSLNADAGPNGPAEFRRDWNVESTFRVRTPATITLISLWVAMSDTDPSGLVSPLGNIAGFRFDANNGDTTWRTRTADGATGGTGDSLVTVAASTNYEMRFVMATSSVKFYINNTLVQTRTTTLPTATAYLRPYVRVRAQVAAVRNFEFSYFHGWHT